MDSVRTSKMVDMANSIPPLPASPVDLDLSHLSREEQEHIANVLKRAQAVDEQPPPIPSAIIPSKQSPPALATSVLLSPLASSSSSSSSTSSFNSENPENNDQNEL